MRALTALLLILLSSVFDAQHATLQATSLLRVKQGRASLVSEGQLFRLSVGSPEQALVLGGHVELGLHDTVELRLPRSLSMTVRNYSSFGVMPSDPRGAATRVQFLFLGNADIELRRGQLALDLPQSWRLEFQRCSFHIKELVDGRIELHHRGGQAVRIIDLDSARGGRPKSIVAGQTLVLPAR